MTSVTHPPPDLDSLFRDCAADLGRYFTRRHGPSESGDLVQESFLQLARRTDRGLPISSPRAFLFGIARRLSLASWRKKARTTEASEAEIAALPAPEPDPDAAAAREVIATLPALQREILDLRFQHGLSYAEIAQALEIPVGTVRSRLHHAMALLRDHLDESPSRRKPF